MNKINRAFQHWPHGAVVTHPWLSRHNLSQRETARHAERGNLVRLGSGAYARPGDSLTWEGGVYGLQYGERPPDLSFWPGGATALALAGYSHYLMLGRETLNLYGRPRVRLSKWFCETEWGVTLAVHRVTLFKQHNDRVFEPYTPAGRNFRIYISSPEMAVLEWLSTTPDQRLFSDTIVDTFGGLTDLRPRRLQDLLQACTSVRVKRVFLLLARFAGHLWYARLDRSAIDLGKGKRQLIKGGTLDKEYQITVPEQFAHAA